MLPALVHNCTNNFPQNGGKKNVKLPNAKGARGSSASPPPGIKPPTGGQLTSRPSQFGPKTQLREASMSPTEIFLFSKIWCATMSVAALHRHLVDPVPEPLTCDLPIIPWPAFPHACCASAILAAVQRKKKKSALPPVFFTLSPARRSRGKQLQSRRMKDDHDKRNQSINCHSFAVAIAQLYNKANLRYGEWGTDTKWALYQVLGHRAKNAAMTNHHSTER